MRVCKNMISMNLSRIFFSTRFNPLCLNALNGALMNEKSCQVSSFIDDSRIDDTMAEKRKLGSVSTNDFG